MSKACPKLPVFHDMSIVEKSNSLIEIIQICLKIYLYAIIDHSWRVGGCHPVPQTYILFS